MNLSMRHFPQNSPLDEYYRLLRGHATVSDTDARNVLSALNGESTKGAPHHDPKAVAYLQGLVDQYQYPLSQATDIAVDARAMPDPQVESLIEREKSRGQMITATRAEIKRAMKGLEKALPPMSSNATTEEVLERIADQRRTPELALNMALEQWCKVRDIASLDLRGERPGYLQECYGQLANG